MNELFLLVDSHSKFEKRGYQAAVDAKKSRAAKGKDNFGPKSGNQTNSKQVRLNVETRPAMYNPCGERNKAKKIT